VATPLASASARQQGRKASLAVRPPPNPRLQRTRRPSLRSGRSLRSLGSPLKRMPLGVNRSSGCRGVRWQRMIQVVTPNTRVQRTRSSPSALREPLTRRPLGARG
jgi:hypothetical protein